MIDQLMWLVQGMHCLECPVRQMDILLGEHIIFLVELEDNA